MPKFLPEDPGGYAIDCDNVSTLHDLAFALLQKVRFPAKP
jgi:hypothetical protein